MASICNYTHPEAQITTGLERSNQGTLFPYNPEFYHRASGLYGPGSSYCWLLLLASFILNWLRHPKNDDGIRCPGISSDLLAVVAFPVFAATDALVQSIRWIGTEYRALAIFCIRFPWVDLKGFAEFNRTQLHLNDIPPDLLSLGQHAVDLSGPLTVCFVFEIVFFFLIAAFHFHPGDHVLLQPLATAQYLVYGSYIYVFIALTTVHLSLGDIGIAAMLGLYQSVTPVLVFLIWVSGVFLLFAFVGGLASLTSGLLKRDAEKAMDGLKTIGSAVVFSAMLGSAVFAGGILSFSFVPDLGISVSERDQVATLIVGVVSLCFTIVDVWRQSGLDDS